MRFWMLAASATIALGGAAGTATAATIINNPPPLDDKVFSIGAQGPATTVQGITAGSSVDLGFLLDISSPQTLKTTGSGFSQFNCPTGDAGGCASISIAPSPSQNLIGFSAIEFSLPDHNQPVTAANGDPFQIFVDYLTGPPQTINWAIESHNSYELLADPGQVITRVTVQGLTHGGVPVNWGDVRQIEFNAVMVPEPASWLMMLMGFFGLGAVLRRRRGSIRVAA